MILNISVMAQKKKKIKPKKNSKRKKVKQRELPMIHIMTDEEDDALNYSEGYLNSEIDQEEQEF
jgi:hypothetical protein